MICPGGRGGVCPAWDSVSYEGRRSGVPIPVGREEIVDRSGEKTQKAAPVGASDRRGFLRVHGENQYSTTPS